MRRRRWRWRSACFSARTCCFAPERPALDDQFSPRERVKMRVSMPAAPLISVRALSKQFRTYRRREGLWGGIQNLFHREHQYVTAVDRVSFSIDRGEMVGYIGPNGAGKSTTIKMLTGILVPSSGEIVINQFVPWRQRTAYVKTIGVVFGQRTQLWWDIAVIESFKLLRRIYDVSQRDFDERMELFNQVLGLTELLDVPVRKLSLG